MQRPLRIGLTGSIAMGKSRTAALLRRMRLPVFCADEAVHDLLANDTEIIQAVRSLCPDSWVAGAINRSLLGKHVFADAKLRYQLEALLHPAVRAMEEGWYELLTRRRAKLAIFDIPLLFETGRNADMDIIWVVHAPPTRQRQRALKRPGMTLERFNAIRALQWPDALKCSQADVVIHTGLGIAYTHAIIKKALALL